MQSGIVTKGPCPQGKVLFRITGECFLFVDNILSVGYNEYKISGLIMAPWESALYTVTEPVFAFQQGRSAVI